MWKIIGVSKLDDDKKKYLKCYLSERKRRENKDPHIFLEEENKGEREKCQKLNKSWVYKGKKVRHNKAFEKWTIVALRK